MSTTLAKPSFFKVQQRQQKGEKRLSMPLSPKNLSVLLALFLIVMTSCVGLVYVKQLNRQLVIKTEQLHKQLDRAHTQWGQLLLEQSAWATQPRVQSFAKNQLQMYRPDTNQIKVVSM